jgi:hypothetical protein
MSGSEMSQPDETRNGEGMILITDEEIRRSLLGCASASQQEKFETQLLLDDQFEQRVQRLELELSDDFTFGRLTETERQLFSSNFLVNHKRARDLAVSRALKKAISVGQPALPKSRAQVWFTALVRQRPFATAFALSMLIVLGAVSWRILKSRTMPGPLIAKQNSASEPGRQYAHPVSPAPTDIDSGKVGETERRVVATVTLHSDDGAAKQTLRWSTTSAEQDRVRFELLVEGDTNGSYQARLVGHGGEIAAFYDLKAEGSRPQVSFTVAPILVPSGEYQIELLRSVEGRIVDKHRYSFQSQQE